MKEAVDRDPAGVRPRFAASIPSRAEAELLAARYVEAMVNGDSRTVMQIESVADSRLLAPTLARMLARGWARIARENGMAPRQMLNDVLADLTESVSAQI